jgi:hypothetical protein
MGLGWRRWEQGSGSQAQPMRPGSIVIGAGLLLIAVSLGYCHARSTQLHEAFGTVALGESERDVVARMGRPHRIVEGCGYYHGRPRAGCAREYVYFPPFTIVDEAWLIGFDTNGAVSHTSHFVSP